MPSNLLYTQFSLKINIKPKHENEKYPTIKNENNLKLKITVRMP